MKSIPDTLVAAVFAAAITLLVAGLLHIPFFKAKELQTNDQMMELRYSLQHSMGVKPDSRLVLAPIDEVSVRELGVGWPIPRDVHGQFLSVLADAEPKTVGWDIFFTDTKSAPPAAPSDSANPPPLTPDQALVEGASHIPRMVTAARGDYDKTDDPLKREDMGLTRPIKQVNGDISRLVTYPSAAIPFPALRKKTFFGFADEDVSGGVRRTMPLLININGMILPSLDLQIIMQYWDIDPDQVVVNLGRDITAPRPGGGQFRIPIDATGSVIVNYRAKTDDFQHQSYTKMGEGLADQYANKQSKERANLPPIKDHIVIVGVDLAGTDAGVNPLDPNSANVTIHLNVLNNILQNDFLRQLSPWVWLPLYALVLFAMGNLMLRVGIVPMVIITLASILLVAAFGFATLWFDNLQVPVAMPDLGLLLLAIAVPSKGFLSEGREKARLKEAMRANLSEKIMNKMLEHPDNLKLGGVKQEITVMFCDIRGFTKYCDNRDSAEVMDVLNEYMEAMTQVVFKYDGTVDKYIGDCIMAFWNAPEPQPDHAQRAVCCAMEMRYALANFKVRRAGLDIELFECGIGIHTGEALVGMMGSSIKRNYTAMGSTVNLSARLETLTKRLNERILISGEVINLLQGDFPITDRGEATVPGFSKPVHVYAVGADQDIGSALKVGRVLATQQEYTAEEVTAPIWQPAPLPEDADPNP